MASGNTPQPAESLIQNKISDLCKIIVSNSQANSGLSVTLPDGGAITIFYIDQYKRIAYIRRPAGEIIKLDNLLGDMTPIISGNNIKLPVGSWVIGTFIITGSSKEALNAVTVESYS